MNNMMPLTSDCRHFRPANRIRHLCTVFHFFNRFTHRSISRFGRQITQFLWMWIWRTHGRSKFLNSVINFNVGRRDNSINRIVWNRCTWVFKIPNRITHLNDRLSIKLFISGHLSTTKIISRTFERRSVESDVWSHSMNITRHEQLIAWNILHESSIWHPLNERTNMMGRILVQSSMRIQRERTRSTDVRIGESLMVGIGEWKRDKGWGTKHCKKWKKDESEECKNHGGLQTIGMRTQSWLPIQSACLCLTKKQGLSTVVDKNNFFFATVCRCIWGLSNR